MAKKAVKSKISKAEKEAIKAEVEQLKNSREFPELTGLLGSAPYKTLASLEWVNDRLPQKEPPIEKLLKKEKERFVLALIRSGSAQAVISELKDAPSKKWKTLFAELAGMGAKRAEEKIKSLKPKEFTAFCETNHIELVRSGAKQTVSKPKTLPKVLAKIEDMREYLKL